MAEVNLAEIKFGGAVGDRQTAKLNSPPNFPAIRYQLYDEDIMGGSIKGAMTYSTHE